MKHRKIVVIGLVLVLIVIAFMVGRRVLGRKLFGDLNSGEIRSISLQIPSSEESVKLNNLDEVVDALNDIVVYRAADSMEVSEGKSAIYRVTFADGYQMAIGVVDSYISVDGFRYKAKAGSCERLLRLAEEAMGE